MKHITHILFFLFCLSSCQSQTKKPESNTTVGGPCEGCEAIFEYGDKILIPEDTLPTFHKNDPKIKLTGTVFAKDGKTPAENVILYIYHTNRKGIYEKKEDGKGWAKRHGYIRGWVKTGNDGNYTFFTFRPTAYPNGQEPEHIHIVVKEPTRNAYYLEDYLFYDDKLLTEKKRAGLNSRGGSGIVQPKIENGILTVKRDLILGLNIPNY